MSNFSIVEGTVAIKQVIKTVAENYAVDSPGQTFTYPFIRSATIERIRLSCSSLIAFELKIFADSSKSEDSIVCYLKSDGSKNFIHVNKLGIDAIYQNKNMIIEILHNSPMTENFKLRIHAHAQR